MIILRIKFTIIILFLSMGNQALSKALTDRVKSDSLMTPYEAYKYIRGIERNSRSGFNPFRTLKNAAFFIPNQLYYGVRFASGYGAQLMNDPKFIDQLEDFFFSDSKRWGWYPVFNVVSGFRPRIGFNLLYQYSRAEGVAKIKYAGPEKFSSELRLSYRIMRQKRIWRFTVSGFKEYDDDLEFYGFGPSPLSEVRSHFQPHVNTDHGIYFMQRMGTQVVIGYRPSDNSAKCALAGDMV